MGSLSSTPLVHWQTLRPPGDEQIQQATEAKVPPIDATIGKHDWFGGVWSHYHLTPYHRRWLLIGPISLGGKCFVRVTLSQIAASIVPRKVLLGFLKCPSTQNLNRNYLDWPEASQPAVSVGGDLGRIDRKITQFKRIAPPRCITQVIKINRWSAE